MTRAIRSLGSFAVALVASLASLSPARADVIAGPASLTNSDSGWEYSGVGFRANINSFLTGFTFQNQGKSDVVGLYDSLGNLLDSVATPGSTPSDAIVVSWQLTAGTQYYLLEGTNTSTGNSKFAIWGAAAPADTEITMTDTGIFTHSLPPSAIGGTTYWAAFTNITTTANTGVPEPSALGLFGIAIAGLAVTRRKIVGR